MIRPSYFPLTLENEFPRLVFFFGWDEDDAEGALEGGSLNTSLVEFEKEQCVRLTFYDPRALARDLFGALPHGYPAIAEPNLLVIPRLTIEHMLRAVAYAIKNEVFLGSCRRSTEECVQELLRRYKVS